MNEIPKRYVFLIAFFLGSISSMAGFLLDHYFETNSHEIAITAPPLSAEKSSLISSALVVAVIEAESGGDCRAWSSRGARGLMQIMRPTWEEFSDYPYDDAFDPIKNVEVGTRYLKWIEKYLAGRGQDSVDKILAAYNGGIGRLERNGFDVGAMPRETIHYVAKVKKIMERNDGITG